MNRSIADAPDRIIAEFDKNGAEKIRISLCWFKGRPYADIRTFYYDQADELKPGKGARLSAAFLPELISALQVTQKIVDDDGTGEQTASSK